MPYASTASSRSPTGCAGTAQRRRCAGSKQHRRRRCPLRCGSSHSPDLLPSVADASMTQRDAVHVSTTSSPRSSTSCADGATGRCLRTRLKRNGRWGRPHRCEGLRNPDLQPFFIAEASASQPSNHYLRRNSQIYFRVEPKHAGGCAPRHAVSQSHLCGHVVFFPYIHTWHSAAPGIQYQRYVRHTK